MDNIDEFEKVIDDTKHQELTNNICETCKAKDICNDINGETLCLALRFNYN